MAENYVNRVEFDALKKEVDDIKEAMKENEELLLKIDKKVDVISEKISSANEIEELKIKPINKSIDELEKKIEKVEGNQTWLWRLLIRSSHRSNLWNSILKKRRRKYGKRNFSNRNVTRIKS